MEFKDYKIQKIVSFLLRFQGGCTRLEGVADPLSSTQLVIATLTCMCVSPFTNCIETYLHS